MAGIEASCPLGLAVIDLLGGIGGDDVPRSWGQPAAILRGRRRGDMDVLADASQCHDDLLKVWPYVGFALHAGCQEAPDGLR